jgi:hypothetical protein
VRREGRWESLLFWICLRVYVGWVNRVRAHKRPLQGTTANPVNTWKVYHDLGKARREPCKSYFGPVFSGRPKI